MIRIAIRRCVALCAVACGLFGSEASPAAGPPGAAEARAFLRSGDYAQVERIARTLLAEAESSSGNDSLDAARAIDLVVASLTRGGKARVPETGALARRAVAIKEKALGPDHAELAASVYGLAEQLRMVGEYPESRGAYERALAIREHALDPGAPELVESLQGLGTFLYKIAEYAKARVLYDRALTVAEGSLGPDHPAVALILVDIARLLRTTGDFKDGRPLLDRALAIQEKSLGPDHVETATTLRELGELHRLTGDYPAARSAFERALVIRERALGPDHLDVADVLTGLGILLRRAGIGRDHTCPEALPVCVRAMAIAEKTLGPDHPELVGYVEGLGWATLQCSHSPSHLVESLDAERLFQRSLAILEKTFGHDQIACTDTLEGLAFSAWGQEHWNAAIQWYRRKLAIERTAFGPDNVAVGFTLLQIADVQIASTLNPGKEPALTGPVLDEALEAERISREHARLTGRSLTESEALHFAATRWRGGLDLAINLSVRGVDPETRRRTWDALIRSRALVLDTVASRHGATLHTDAPGVAHLAQVMEAARARLANLTVQGFGAMDAEERRKTLIDARRQTENAERTLAAKSASFTAVLERSNLGLDDVIASLPPGSALVAYAIYSNYPWDGLSNRYVAFVLRTGEKFPAAVPLGTEEEVDRLVADWRRSISTPPEEGVTETADRAAGERLRRKIWDPLREHLGDAKRLFVVPDGGLNTVSFAALPVGRDAYLVENGPTLHYLSSERDLVVPKKTVRGDGLLAIGGPAYEATPLLATPLVASARPYRGPRSSCESFQKMRFAPLPGAESEASGLLQLWKEARRNARDRPDASRRLLGNEASEAAFKRLAPGRRIVHVATHAFFLGGECASALDSASSGDSKATTGAGENPLLLSGLAFAGANQRASAGPGEEDGILTAEEIASLDLSGVEWAVLSACDTASGDVRAGEGVLGLQRAFRIAGARTLVMSLWQVDDKATRRWMRELYREHLERGLDTATAVRGATLSALADRRRKGLSTHPFYWAGFIAAGDWR